MANRLRVKNKKRNKDLLTLAQTKQLPTRHKIKKERSTKALFKKNARMT